MQVKNPTNDKIEVKIKGITYEIEAEGSLSNVPEEHARYWQESLHKFIILRKDKLEETVSELVDIPTPPMPDSAIEAPEEVLTGGGRGVVNSQTEADSALTTDEPIKMDSEEVVETTTEEVDVSDEPVKKVAKKTNKKK